MKDVNSSLLKAYYEVINGLNIPVYEGQEPDNIKDKAILAIRQGRTKYTNIDGITELKKAVANKFLIENHLNFNLNEIIVSSGAKQVIYNLFMASLNADDEVLIPSPYWVSYPDIVALCGGTPRIIETIFENKFKLTCQQLEKNISTKTKWLILCSPSNPTGVTYSKEELEALANLFTKYPGITILSDEIYEYINFVGKHESIAQFDAIKDQIIVINGLSKGFAMTGWRLGYTASSVELAKAMEKLQGQFTSGTCSITQKAAVTALVGDLKPSIEMTEEFTRRREKTLALVNDIPGFKCFAPQGAFYVFPDVSAYYGKSDGTTTIKNAPDFSMYILNEANVSSVMGDAFGEPNCVRFSFANSMPNIERAWARIKEALAKLK